MKRILPLILFLIVTTFVTGQEIDSKVKQEYFNAFSGMSVYKQEELKRENRSHGVLLVTEFTIDTLNKEKFSPKPPKKVKPIRVAGREVIVESQPGPDDGGKNYEHLFAQIVSKPDTFMLFAYTPGHQLLRSVYNNDFNTFCLFTMVNDRVGFVRNQFNEWSADSTVKRYRLTASSKNVNKIIVPIKIQSCYFSEPVSDKTEEVYGKAVFTTDPFYAKDDEFSGKYIHKRYKMTVLFRAPVQQVKK